MSLRWRWIAALVVAIATLVSIFALAGGPETPDTVMVTAASQTWVEGRPPGEYVPVEVPEDLAVFFVTPSGLAETVAAVDIPAGSLVSPAMLEPQSLNTSEDTTLMRLVVTSDLWPGDGPFAGAHAVFSADPGECATALLPLVDTDSSSGSAGVTIEVTAELAAILAGPQWWIWESPEAGWPLCTIEEVTDVVDGT